MGQTVLAMIDKYRGVPVNVPVNQPIGLITPIDKKLPCFNRKISGILLGFGDENSTRLALLKLKSSKLQRSPA